jgi:hypothetical protein
VGANLSTHEDFQRKAPPETGSNRSFGIVFFVVFLIVATAPLLSAEPVRYWSLGLAFLCLLVSFVRPALLAPFNKLWGRLGYILSKIVNPLVLGLMFFGVITPTGIIMRLAGKDILRLRLDKTAKSYWIDRTPPGPAPESMKNQF